jgi:L-malate glycosyltransferase
MHILLVPSWYSTERNPTRGLFFFAQAQALKNAGHRVAMLVPPSRFRTRNGLGEAGRNWRKKNTDITIYDQRGILVYRIPWWGSIPSIMPWRRGALGLEIFDRYVQEQGQPDVLHGHSILYGGYLAVSIGLARQIPSVVTEHNSTFTRHLLQPGQPAFVRYTMRQAGKMLAVSPFVARTLQPFGDRRTIDVVGNVVDTNLFRPPSTAPPESPFVVTIIGHLDSNKSQDILLHAFATAFTGKDATLQVIGDGPKWDEYRRLSQKLAIASQVIFWGQQSPTEVCRIIQQSHVVVSTSKVETFGVTLIEAMACGKPIITTRSGGPEYFVDERSGILVDVGDIHGLAHALAQIRQNYQRYDPAYIRQVCVERFSETAIVQQLEKAYLSVQGQQINAHSSV